MFYVPRESETRNINPHGLPKTFFNHTLACETGKMPLLCRRSSGNARLSYTVTPFSLKVGDVFVKMGDYHDSSSVAEGRFLLLSNGERWLERGVGGLAISVYQTCPVPVRLWGAD